MSWRSHANRRHLSAALGALLGALLLACVGCSGPAFGLDLQPEAGPGLPDDVSLAEAAMSSDGEPGLQDVSDVRGQYTLLPDGGGLGDSGELDAPPDGLPIVWQPDALPPLPQEANVDVGQDAEPNMSDSGCERGAPGGPFTVQAPTIDLGIVEVGNTSLTDIYITNQGCRATLTTITEDVSPPISPYVFGGSLINECQGQVLGQGQACDYQVVFRPQATGPFTETVAATINGQVLTFGVSGFGT